MPPDTACVSDAPQHTTRIDEFLSCQVLAESSHAAYRYELVRTSKSLGATPLENATQVQVMQFLLQEHQRGVRAAALRRTTIALRRYFHWLVEIGHRPDNPAKELTARRAPQAVPRRIGLQETQRLLAVQPSGPSRESLRDQALLELSCRAGLSTRDMLALKLQHVDLQQAAVVVFRDSARVERTVVSLPPGTAQALAAYLREGRAQYLRPDQPSDHVFLTRLGRPMSSSGLWRHLQTLGQLAGLPSLSTGRLASAGRHLAACAD